MATLADRILASLRDGPADDDALAVRLGVVRQAVNQAARRLERDGLLARSVGAGGKLENRLPRDPAPSPPEPRPGDGLLLSEDAVKAAVSEHLTAQGWAVTVAWGRQRGIDIEARRGGEHLIIEAKGEVTLPPQQVNYFLGALGELVQRMDDPAADYGLALPDNRQYRGLVERLPALAKQRLNLVVFFVGRSTDGRYTIDELRPA